MLNETFHRHLIAYAVASLLVATGIAYGNDYFDKGNTSEDLQLACDDLKLKPISEVSNEAPNLTANCNSDAGTKAASIKLGEGIGKELITSEVATNGNSKHVRTECMCALHAPSAVRLLLRN